MNIVNGIGYYFDSQNRFGCSLKQIPIVSGTIPGSSRKLIVSLFAKLNLFWEKNMKRQFNPLVSGVH